MFPHTNIIHYNIIKFTILTIAILLSVIQAYNLNVNKATAFSHPHKYKLHRESYFGYTVALYNDPNYKDQSVLVGAPRANTSQTSLNEPGTIYKCTLNRSDCSELSVDSTVDESYDAGTIVRNNSWLGASISVENRENPRVVVCAPRWKIKWGLEWYMNGACYYTKINSNGFIDENSVDRIVPFTDRHEQTDLDNNGNGYYKYGMALFGFSLNTFSYKNEWNIIFGAPGAYSSLGTSGVVYRNQSQFQSVIGGVTTLNNEYLGYSVTSSKSFKNQVQYVAGAPTGPDVQGVARIFNYNPMKTNINEIDTLNSSQKGDYFGSALASCDINNDGIDEIIVGAPMWTNLGDEGSVYIFIKGNTGKFKLLSRIDGEIKDARFGTTVVCLGDIDRDGYQDIAIGAPYENNHGSVYIYNGNKHGLFTTWSQRISGNEFSHNLQGFGISISEPRDIDGNGYFDVAIGAYLSGHAIILRSHPVVSVNIKIDTHPKHLHDKLPSFPIKICSFYTGVRAPKSLDTIIKVKVDEEHERAFIPNLKREERTYIMPIKLTHNDHLCERIIIHLNMERIQNVIDPIKILVSLILDSESISSSITSDNLYFDVPVMNKNMSRNEDNITVSFYLNCGIENICHSNITLNVTTYLGNDNHFVRGSKDAIKLFIDVHNYGDPAYETETHILMPDRMTLMNVPVNCKAIRNNGIYEIIWNIGNLLQEKINITLELVIKDAERIESVEIITFVTTRSNNLNSNQSEKNITIYFDDDIDITISGNPHKPWYLCYDNIKKDKLETIQFQHVYAVRKFGVTPILQSRLTIAIPTHIIDAKRKKIMEIARINRTDIALHEVISRQKSHCFQKKMKHIYPDLQVSEINISNEYGLSINCMNPLVICETIICTLESFSTSSTIGEVIITMELRIKNLTDNVLNGTNIIHFVSNGYINITLPTGIMQKPLGKPDYVEVKTTFDSSATNTRSHIPIWIIVVSALLGIVLLALLTFGLIKFGFFNRKEKEELEALKSNEDKKRSIIIETTSSTEVLDQDHILDD